MYIRSEWQGTEKGAGSMSQRLSVLQPEWEDCLVIPSIMASLKLGNRRDDLPNIIFYGVNPPHERKTSCPEESQGQDIGSVFLGFQDQFGEDVCQL